MGDLKGIIEKLDYIKSLGVTMVLLNFSDQQATIEVGNVGSLQEVLISNYASVAREGAKVTLEPYQAVLLSLE